MEGRAQTNEYHASFEGSIDILNSPGTEVDDHYVQGREESQSLTSFSEDRIGEDGPLFEMHSVSSAQEESLGSFSEDRYIREDPLLSPTKAPLHFSADAQPATPPPGTDTKPTRRVSFDDGINGSPGKHRRFRQEFLEADLDFQLHNDTSKNEDEIEITFEEKKVAPTVNDELDEAKPEAKPVKRKRRRPRTDFRYTGRSERDLSGLNDSVIFEDESGILFAPGSDHFSAGGRPPFSKEEDDLDGNDNEKPKPQGRRSFLGKSLSIRSMNSSRHSDRSSTRRKTKSREQLLELQEKLRQEREREMPQQQLQLQYQQQQQQQRMGDSSETSSIVLPQWKPPVLTQTSRSGGSGESDEAPPDELGESFSSGIGMPSKSGWLRDLRVRCGTIVEKEWVQLWVIYLILLNGLTMGIATFDFVTEDPGVDNAFEIVDKCFLTIFTIEIGLQQIYRGVSLYQDGWLVFDLVVVVLSWSLESFQIIRAFRIFRAFRLVTRIGPMRELVMAIGAVMPNLYAIFMMLLLVFYIFAVLFTHLFRDVVLETDNGEIRYFGDLGASLFTCMELMTMEWAQIVRPINAELSWAWLPFSAFLTVTGFISFNLIVAVVCDAVRVVDVQIKAEYEAEQKLLKGYDSNEDDEVSLPGKLKRAKLRIEELSKQVRSMKSQHVALNEAVAKLLEEKELFVQQQNRQAESSSDSKDETKVRMEAKPSSDAKDETKARREKAMTFSPHEARAVKRRSSI